MRTTLTVYGRSDCHLCQDMLHALADYQAELAFDVKFVDVDYDEALREQYGLRVPVLVAINTEICHYFLDKQALFRYFGAL